MILYFITYITHTCSIRVLSKSLMGIYYINVQTHIIPLSKSMVPCRVGSVSSVSASRTVGREFASRPGHTKDHHKNGTNCLPAWHAMR